MKAVSLFSGGLDSIMASRLIADQGVDVEALYFKSVFWEKEAKSADRKMLDEAASQAHVKLHIIEAGRPYFEIVKNPVYGYGKNLNPCIDCRIFMMKKAKAYMQKHKASFLITGEVLGQRSMSQHKPVLNRIEKQSDTQGIVVRPLSAKLFKESVPEENKWVERSKLFAIQGKSRKTQLRLAKKLGIKAFLNPAGGCLLTDKGFSDKMRDLIQHKKDFTENDVKLIKSGRTFRISARAKLAVGRNEKQNRCLLGMAKEKDYIFLTRDIPGPVGIGRGLFDRDAVKKSAGIVARYSDSKPREKVKVYYRRYSGKEEKSVLTVPVDDKVLKRIRL